MTDRLMPPPRPVGPFFRHYALLVGGAAVVPVAVAIIWLAFVVRPDLEARALADAPLVEARVSDTNLGGIARYSMPRITYVLPSGVEASERFIFAPGAAEEIRKLRPGGPIPVHVDGSGRSASDLHVRAARDWLWALLAVPAIMALILLLFLPLLLELRAAAVRIRRWPAALAEVRVTGRGPALRVRARYDLVGSAPAEMRVSAEEWGRWTKLAGVPPEGDTASLPVLVDPRQPDRWRPCRLEWPWVVEGSPTSTKGDDGPFRSSSQSSSVLPEAQSPALYTARYAPSLKFGGAELSVQAVTERHVVVRGPDWSFTLDVTEGEPFLSVLETGLAALDAEHLLVMASYEHDRAAGALGYRYACLGAAGALRWTLVSSYEAFAGMVLLPGLLLRLAASPAAEAPLEVQALDLDTGAIIARQAVRTPEHMRAACREIGAQAQGRFDVRDGRTFVLVSLHPNIRALPSYMARGRPDRGILTIPDEGKFEVEVLLPENIRRSPGSI